ncbi:MAG: hypothetical protein LBK56_13535 [Gracilibacteraceae bacterium]|jgi:hypothetical protein|nr:hypothetical protein [Gracilibacteraceae bacterium]
MNMKGRVTLHMKNRVTPQEKMSMADDFKSFMRNLEYCHENRLPATDPKVRELAGFWNNLIEKTRNSATRGEVQALSAPDLAGFDLNRRNVSAELFEYLQKAVNESSGLVQ